MKTLKQFREETDDRCLDLVSKAPKAVMLEGRERKDKDGKHPSTPVASDIPSMLLFRRIAYRLYPKNQVVALYYSKVVDKYLSVPFGPDGNLNLSESSVYNTQEEFELNEGAKWDAVKGGVSGAIHGAIRGGAIGGIMAPGPGTALGAAIGGARGAYKGAKKAYNKADQQSVKESFSNKLSSIREQQVDEDWKDTLVGIGKAMPGYQDKEASKQAFKKGDYWGAIKSQGKALGKAAATGAAVAGSLAVGRALAPMASRAAAGGAASDLASRAVDAVTGGSNTAKPEEPKTSAIKRIQSSPTRSKSNKKAASSWSQAAKMVKAPKTPAPVPTVKENKISDIRAMVESGGNHDMNINGRQVTLNTGMAKRILEVYDSVNTKNKKIVESMLNEDLESFKKLLNFSIKK